MVPHPSTQRQRGYGYVNEQASPSVASQTVPLYSQDGTSYPYTHHHANHHPHHHPHHQSISQSHVSRGAPVIATPAAYATTGGHFFAPVPAVRNGLNALSESMPGQLNASVVTGYLDPSQDSMYLPVWGASFFPGGDGFGGTDGLVEDYHRRYEQESFGTYDECQRSTGGPSVYGDSLDSDSAQCCWGDCSSFEFYDRVALWKHIKDCHHRPSREDGRFVCRWENCPDERGFKEFRSLRRHIDSQHAFRRLYECGCGRRWGRPDKLKEHQAKHPSHKP